MLRFCKHISYGDNDVHVPKGKKISIEIYGHNNSVVIENHKFKGKIKIYGNNNKINISDSRFSERINISIGCDAQRCTNNTNINVGKDTYCGNIYLVLGEHGSDIQIGNNCMLSDNIYIYATDGHTITDMDGNRTNFGKHVTIGNHVWVGQDVHIGKNVTIPDDTIIGWGAVVTKSFDKTNTVIAGNPATVVKTGVKWDRAFPNNFDKKDKQ